MSKRLLGWVFLLLLTTSFVISNSVVRAQPIQSTNYQFDESAITSGSSIQSSSANFQASDATGDLVIGNTASGNYQIETGSQTTHYPALSCSVNGGDINFGSFTASAATVTSATFSISNYTSFGYVVQIIGEPPSNESHTLPSLATNSDSQSGIEQFGINLVANTVPNSIGANPNNGQFGFGTAAPNYNTSNKYRYVSGETIAMGPKSSGITSYTISYLVNVNSLTPGGKYTTNQTLVVTGTY